MAPHVKGQFCPLLSRDGARLTPTAFAICPVVSSGIAGQQGADLFGVRLNARPVARAFDRAVGNLRQQLPMDAAPNSR